MVSKRRSGNFPAGEHGAAPDQILKHCSIANTHRIRRAPKCRTRGAEPASDFHFVERDDPEKIAPTLVKLVQERIPQRFGLDPIRDVQVLCPMNRGSLGVRELNEALQSIVGISIGPVCRTRRRRFLPA